MDVISIPSIIILILTLFLIKVWFRAKSKPNLNLPPGPKKLPLIGSMHLLSGSRPPHHTLAELAVKYGPLMHLQLGEIPTFVVTSPEIAKEFLSTHDVIFANRPPLLLSEIMNYNHTDIAFAPLGEYWRQLRKICTLELLSAKRVRSFRPVREEEYSNLCRWIASKEGSQINLTKNVESTSFVVFTKAAIGEKSSEQDLFISTITELTTLAAGYVLADVYPSIELIRLISPTRIKAQGVHKKLKRILEGIINEHRAANAEGKQGEDLLDVLLSFNEDGNELYLSTDNIQAVLLDIFTAGTETSSTTINWAMAELLKNPRVLQKAQDEVRRVFEKKGFVDESMFDELNYLKRVIKETLRLHPPLPLLIPRESSERCKVHGYDIPAKGRVMVNAWAIGRDPKHWKDAESFEPERFVDSRPIDFQGKNFEYIPFGSGRRICPGMTFGLANVYILLSMLLYHFDWTLPDGMRSEDIDMTEAFNITAKRKNVLQVIPKLRIPLP